MMGLSEQAKVAYLQEKIKQAKRSERGSWIIIIFGIIIAFVSYSLPEIDVLVNNSVVAPPFLLGIIAGILFAVFGSVESIYNGVQANNLMEQLRRMGTTIPRCHNCQKELPRENFEFCPFCGKSLKS